jgi:diamine N-acetyltransferase
MGNGMSSPEPLTLAHIAREPQAYTHRLEFADGERLVFRPLAPEDEPALMQFMAGLSPETQRFSNYGGDAAVAARELCEAIARYDKLRMVAVVGAGVIALFEFSLDLVPEDFIRYRNYGIELDAATDMRFGVCIADAYQSRGLGSRLLPFMWDIARGFGRQRVLLWGGVYADNMRAIRYYEKNGFHLLGRFHNGGGESWDGMLLLDPGAPVASSSIA